MPQSLTHITLIVRDYDEAIAWFTEKLGFTLIADEVQPEQDKRWVLVAPPGAGDNAATFFLPSAALPTMLRIAGTLARLRPRRDAGAGRLHRQPGGRARLPVPEDRRFQP